MACSNWSLEKLVLMKSSCRAPALSAMAFHPLVVGTVTRILISPLASRTGRITPGIMDRIAAGLLSSKRSRTFLRPSTILCSTFSFPWTFRSRMGGLLEPLPVLEIDAEGAIFVPQRHRRPFAVEIPLHPHDLLAGDRQIRDVSECNVGGYLLFHGETGLRNDGDVGELGIDLDMADSEELLQAPGVGRDGLREEGVASVA